MSRTPTPESVRQMIQDARSRGLSAKAIERLEWILHYCENGQNATDTARMFGIPRMTFYRALRRFNPEKLELLEDQSRAPHRRGGRWAEAVTQEKTEDIAQPETVVLPQVQPVTVAASVEHSTHDHCFFCTVKSFNWKIVKRTLVMGSVLANIALLAMFLTTVLLEKQEADIKINASLIDNIQDYTLIPNK